MRKKMLATQLALALAAYGAQVQAQTQAQDTPPAAPGAPASAAVDVPVSTVVVTGFRSSLQKALNLKQQAIGVRDSIVAEDIGKFPEANVAESLQRVPGVILNRDETSGEGARISIRGLPTEYSVTTLNGAPVNTTSTGGIGGAARGFNYDVFASELFGRVDFYKSPLAELTEGGLGGVVDLQTPRPFDNPKGAVRYGVTASYNTMSKKVDPMGYALMSKTWGNWGMLLGGSHTGGTNNRSGFEATGGYNSSALGRMNPSRGTFPIELDYGDPRTNLSGYTREQVDNALLPRIYRFYGSSNERSRDGLVSSLQYKTPTLNLSFDTLYSKLENRRDEIYFGMLNRWSKTTDAGRRTDAPGRGNHSGLVPIDVKIDPSSNLLTGTFGNTTYSSGAAYSNDETRFRYNALNVQWKASDKLILTGQISDNSSKAERASTELSGQIFGITSTFDYGSDHVYPSLSSPTSYTDPTNYAGFGTSTGLLRELDKGRQARLIADYAYDLPGEWTGRLKGGLVYVETSKGVHKRNGTASGNAKRDQLGDAGMRASMTSTLPVDNLDMGGGWPAAWGTWSRDYVYGNFNPYALNPGAAFSPADSFTAKETVSSAFIQSDFTGQVLGRELRVNAGVRYSETRTDIENFKRRGAGLPYDPNQEQGKYSNVLPAVSAAFDLTDKLMWRASLGKTISRASLTIIAAQTVVPNPFDPVASAGNPNLRPQASTNLDTSLEWYFQPGALLSAALFKKDMTDATIAVISQTTFGALGLPDTAMGALFRDASGRVDPNLPMTLRTSVNAGKQTLKGFELAYQQNFDFLPAPFKGFGALASYTYIDPFSSRKWITNAGGEIDVNTVPKYAYSVTGYYDRGPLAVRFSYNHKGRSLHGHSLTNTGDDLIRWNSARGYLDGSLSYRISDKLELRLDALNLSNTLGYDYFEDVTGKYGSGRKTRMDYAKYDGRTIKIGLRGSL